MGSPYPWHYTVRWPYYFLRPSAKPHIALPRSPLAADLEALSGERTCRLVFFGDMMCMKHDRVPAVHPSLRRLLMDADLVIGNCEAPVTVESNRRDAAYLIVFKMS